MKRTQLKFEYEPVYNVLPEHRLLFAVLQRAILDVCGSVVRASDKKEIIRIRKSARKYIFRSEPDSPMSFEWICDELNLDIESLRRGIRRALNTKLRIVGNRGPSQGVMASFIEEIVGWQSFIG